MKDMLAELNHMLEQRERGEEPDFEGFMERYGDFFPENPQTLDELLEQMARSMAQMQQLLNSMSPEQRAQLQELANSLLDDMDLRWQVDQLGQNLRNAFPQMGWGQQMRFRGDEPLPLEGMQGLLDQLGDIDALENLMRNATSPGPLAEVDLDKVQRAPRRGRGAVAATAREGGEGARGSRPHRTARRPARAHAQGHPPHRPARARRPLQAPAPGPRGQARDRALGRSGTNAPTSTSPTSSAIRSTSTSGAH